MNATLTTLICIAVFLAHFLILFGHKQKMGADPKDTPQDPLFSRNAQYLAFGSVLTTHFLAMIRRVFIAHGMWTPDTGLLHFADLFSIPATTATLLTGALIFSLGAILRLWSIRILGRLFTFEIGIRPQHKIIETGPYAIVRHPSYTGYFLMIIGATINCASPFLMSGALLGTFGFLTLRIRQEEKMLVRHFGPSYREYQQRTKRLIPFIY